MHAVADALGEPLEFGDQRAVRENCVYGLWRPEGWGCWIAGREARLGALKSPATPDLSLLLELAAGGMVAVGSPRQRLDVLIDRDPVASLVFDRALPGVDNEGIVLPAQLVRGRRHLEIVLRAPNAISPANLGTSEDQRILGAFLQRLTIRSPRQCELGQRLGLGVGEGDEQMLAGGWCGADPGGRWTRGTTARMLLRPTATPTTLEWNAHALMPHGAPPLRVEVTANGVALGTVDYDASRSTAQLSLGDAAMNGESAHFRGESATHGRQGSWGFPTIRGSSGCMFEMWRCADVAVRCPGLTQAHMGGQPTSKQDDRRCVMPDAVDFNSLDRRSWSPRRSRPRSLVCGRTRPATSRTSTTTSSRWSLRAAPRPTIDWVHRILKEERDIVISSRPLEATAFQVENIRIAYVFYESGLSINVMYTVDDPTKRAVGFKLSEGIEVPSRQAVRGTHRGLLFRPKNRRGGTGAGRSETRPAPSRGKP